MWPLSPWKHQSMAGLVAHGSGPTKANCWISAKVRPASWFTGRAGWTWSSFGGCLYGVPKVNFERPRAPRLLSKPFAEALPSLFTMHLHLHYNFNFIIISRSARHSVL